MLELVCKADFCSVSKKVDLVASTLLFVERDLLWALKVSSARFTERQRETSMKHSERDKIASKLARTSTLCLMSSGLKMLKELLNIVIM